MLALLSSPVTAASYSLVENWQGKNFLDYFNFHVGTDPTNGYVNYLDKSSAESAGLVKLTDSGSVYLGVDHATKLDPNGKGRDSVRIGSKKYYDQSLVIADIAHMPGSVCGTWPAFWSVGKEWPGDGEIDIIEGVNLQDHNEIVMHTAGTCSLTDTDMTGTVNATGCGEDLGTVGCVIEGHKGSYGTSFNSQGGGVYAMEWTDDYLKIWYFPRSSIPASIKSGKPDVTQFGTPMALVEESCDVANAFKSQSFIFDVTFCGDWAGGVFGNSGCPATDADSFKSCHNYVANHPAVFKESYWEINSVKIYQTGVKGIASISSSESRSTTAAAVPSASETTFASQAAATSAAAASTSSTENASIGAVQELSTASDSAPTASAESLSTEQVENSANKKTRTVTAHVTATTTICPEAEKSSSMAAHPSAAILPHPSHGSVPPANQQSVPTPSSQPAPVRVSTTVAPGAYTWSAETAPTSAANPGAASSPVQPAPSAAPSGPATSAEKFGASWVQSSALPSAVVSSVPYDASSALISAPTDVSPESASSTTAVLVPSGSQSGVSPVFTGSAGRISTSISAVVFALIIAVLV
jgi:hypothetical protein